MSTHALVLVASSSTTQVSAPAGSSTTVPLHKKSSTASKHAAAVQIIAQSSWAPATPSVKEKPKHKVKMPKTSSKPTKMPTSSDVLNKEAPLKKILVSLVLELHLTPVSISFSSDQARQLSLSPASSVASHLSGVAVPQQNPPLKLALVPSTFQRHLKPMSYDEQHLPYAFLSRCGGR